MQWLSPDWKDYSDVSDSELDQNSSPNQEKRMGIGKDFNARQKLKKTIRAVQIMNHHQQTVVKQDSAKQDSIDRPDDPHIQSNGGDKEKGADAREPERGKK